MKTENYVKSILTEISLKLIENINYNKFVIEFNVEDCFPPFSPDLFQQKFLFLFTQELNGKVYDFDIFPLKNNYYTVEGKITF